VSEGVTETAAVVILAVSDNRAIKVPATVVLMAGRSSVAVGLTAPGKSHPDKISAAASARNTNFWYTVNLPLNEIFDIWTGYINCNSNNVCSNGAPGVCDSTGPHTFSAPNPASASSDRPIQFCCSHALAHTPAPHHLFTYFRSNHQTQPVMLMASRGMVIRLPIFLRRLVQNL